MQSSMFIFQKVSAGLIEASASYKEQSSPQRILVLFWMWGYTRIGFIKSAPEAMLALTEDLSANVPGLGSASCLLSPPWTPSGVLKINSNGNTLILVRVNGIAWQVPVCGWQFWGTLWDQRLPWVHPNFQLWCTWLLVGHLTSHDHLFHCKETIILNCITEML